MICPFEFINIYNIKSKSRIIVKKVKTLCFIFFRLYLLLILHIYIIMIRRISLVEINRMNSYKANQWAGPSSFLSGASLIKSSIRRIVIAASVANLSEFIFEIIGSSTPAFKLLRGQPFVKSNPQYLSYNLFGSVSPSFWEAAWRVLSFEISSVASLAALTANVLGITFKA